jgi:hypothetical protein
VPLVKVLLVAVLVALLAVLFWLALDYADLAGRVGR